MRPMYNTLNRFKSFFWQLQLVYNCELPVIQRVKYNLTQ